MKKNDAFIAKLVAHINRKKWWHVPPRDRSAYGKRGKFFASSFREAEFWGRPLDKPEKVKIARPLIGDEETIEKKLFGRQVSRQGMTAQERWVLDAKMKRAAMAKGYDAIVLMTLKGISEFRVNGKMPRSVELNVVNVPETESEANGRRKAANTKKQRQ